MEKTCKGKFLYGYVIAACCFGIQAFGIGTYFSYGVLFNPLISEFGWSRAAVAGASSVAFFLSKRVMIFCFILLITALLWLQIARVLWMLYFFAVIYGFAHGGFFTTFSPVVAEFFGIKSHGALFGIAMFSGTFGGAAGPFLAGYIFDVTAGYGVAIWICALVVALGFGMISLLKPFGEVKTLGS